MGIFEVNYLFCILKMLRPLALVIVSFEYITRQSIIKTTIGLGYDQKSFLNKIFGHTPLRD